MTTVSSTITTVNFWNLIDWVAEAVVVTSGIVGFGMEVGTGIVNGIEDASCQKLQSMSERAGKILNAILNEKKMTKTR